MKIWFYYCYFDNQLAVLFTSFESFGGKVNTRDLSTDMSDS